MRRSACSPPLCHVPTCMSWGVHGSHACGTTCPRTPPSCFCIAVIIAPTQALVMHSSAWARARSSAARKSSWDVSASSRQSLSISWVHLPCPGELLDGALARHFVNMAASRFTGVGLLANTSTGISRTCSCGLRFRNSTDESLRGQSRTD